MCLAWAIFTSLPLKQVQSLKFDEFLSRFTQCYCYIQTQMRRILEANINKKKLTENNLQEKKKPIKQSITHTLTQRRRRRRFCFPNERFHFMSPFLEQTKMKKTTKSKQIVNKTVEKISRWWTRAHRDKQLKNHTAAID